jgi:hypothetical protein
MESELIRFITTILAGLATSIPLIINLVKYVQKSIKERNWTDLLNMILELMETAESKFSDGAERKEWLLAMVKASADSINYDIDMDEVDTLVDSLCAMSKVVNAPASEDTDDVNDGN